MVLKAGNGKNEIMKNEKKQYAGICLDNAHAIIIAANADETGEYAIKDKVKAPEHHGGGSEHAMNNAQRADSHKFFKTLSGYLGNYDELLIFGPGKIQEEFKNFLSDDAHFNAKKITTESAGNLTDPQMVALVRDFYKQHN
jgi:stalled ribosome rescue protein Dom34